MDADAAGVPGPEKTLALIAPDPFQTQSPQKAKKTKRGCPERKNDHPETTEVEEGEFVWWLVSQYLPRFQDTPDSLIIINDILSLLRGPKSLKWRNKKSIEAVLKASDIPHYTLDSCRLSDFNEHGGKFIQTSRDEMKEVFVIRRASCSSPSYSTPTPTPTPTSEEKTKPEELILLHPEDLQYLCFVCRRNSSAFIIRRTINLFNNPVDFDTLALAYSFFPDLCTKENAPPTTAITAITPSTTAITAITPPTMSITPPISPPCAFYAES